METVQVIYWKYSDGSGCDIVKVYKNKEKAEEDLNMLREHCQDVKDFLLVQAAYNDD